LQSAYVPRVDYGDLASSVKFQTSFLKSMNAYFEIEDDDIIDKLKQKLLAKGLELNPQLNNQLIVDAKFEDIDHLKYDFAVKGRDYDYDMSYNDVERTFNYLCYKLLTEQTDEDAKITNVARSWNRLKSALRIWFKSTLGAESGYYYRVFVYDVLEKGPSSIFRPAITQALKDYRPILNKLLKEKKQKAEKTQSPIFRIQNEYAYTNDYTEVPQTKCILDKCFLRNEYDGKQHEINFIQFIDRQKNIYWWFKNGDQGINYYALKYFNTTEQAEKLFYPDWIIKFVNGKIGIFDTKSGRTLNTEGRARGLSLKIRELGNGYIGGIVRFANGIFEYSDSMEYDDVTPKKNVWKPFLELFV